MMILLQLLQPHSHTESLLAAHECYECKLEGTVDVYVGRPFFNAFVFERTAVMSRCRKSFLPIASITFFAMLAGTVSGDDRTTAHVGAQAISGQQVIDVIATQGRVHGIVVDEAGMPVCGHAVAIQSVGEEPLRATTDQQGRFELSVPTQVRRCVFATGYRTQPIRLWSHAAPQSAVCTLVILDDSRVVRGQDTLFGFNPQVTGAVTLGVAAATVVALALDDDNSPASP